MYTSYEPEATVDLTVHDLTAQFPPYVSPSPVKAIGLVAHK